MLYNREYYRKVNDKKLLHKIGKHWATVSVSVLAMLGGASLLTHSAHADATPTATAAVNASPAQQQGSGQQSVPQQTTPAQTQIQPQAAAQTSATSTVQTQQPTQQEQQPVQSAVPQQNVQSQQPQVQQSQAPVQSAQQAPASTAPQVQSQQSAQPQSQQVQQSAVQPSAQYSQQRLNAGTQHQTIQSTTPQSYSQQSPSNALDEVNIHHFSNQQSYTAPYMKQSIKSNVQSIAFNEAKQSTQASLESQGWQYANQHTTASPEDIQKQASDLHSDLVNNKVSVLGQRSRHLLGDAYPNPYKTTLAYTLNGTIYNSDIWEGPESQLVNGAYIHAPSGYHVSAPPYWDSSLNSFLCPIQYGSDSSPSIDNMTVTYVDNGAIVHTANISGTNETNAIPQIQANVPSGYHAVDLTSSYNFWKPNSDYQVNVQSDSETDTIFYVYNNQHVGQTTATGIGQGAVNTNIPSGFHLAADGTSDITYDGGVHNVDVIPNQMQEHINFNGDSSANTTVTGNTNTQGNVNAPSGFHYINGSNGQFTYNGGTVTFNVLQNTMQEHINFNGDPSANTTVTGNTNTQGHVNAPNGYHFTNGSNGGFTYNGGTTTFNVAENNLTDQIHYVLSGGNIPSNYQGRTGQLGATSLTGIAHAGINTQQLNNVPANYHIIGNPGLNYDGNEHDVQIAPNIENLNVTYHDQNGHTYSGAINGAYDQKLNDVTTGYNMPNGYHLNGSQDASYIFNGNQNQSKDLNITGNQQSGNVSVTIHKYDGSTPEGTTVVTVPESGPTGNGWSINPNNYAPAGYRAQNGTLNGSFTPNGLSQGNATFNYSAQAGSAITVNYINQNGQRVSSGTIPGNVDDQGSIGSKVGVPSGYNVNGGQPSSYHVTANAQAPINIQVTGLDSSQIPGNGTFTATIQKSVNGHVISSTPQQVHINGRVGDNYTVTPSNYTPTGYTSTSNPVQGSISPNGLTSNNGTFVYTANAGDSINVTYKDQTGQTVKSGSIKGVVDSTGNVYNVVPMPNGYHYASSNQLGANGSNINYHISTTPQNIVINIVGNSNVPSGHVAIPLNPNDGDNHAHNNKPSDVPMGPNGDIPNPTPYDPADAHDTFYVTVNEYRQGGQSGGYMKRYTINGNVGDHFSINPNDFTPVGYHESDDSVTNGQITTNGLAPDQVSYKYEANAFNPSNRSNPNASDAITVRYVDSTNGHTVRTDTNAITGYTDQQGSVIQTDPAPAGYNVNPNQNTNYHITQNHQIQQINISPIHQTDDVRFEMAGANIPSGYQGKTGVVNSDRTDYNGNDYRATEAGNNSFNVNPQMKGVPAHLHATGMQIGNNTNYDGGVHTVEVTPDDENLNVTYVDQNGNKHSTAINGAYDQTISDIGGDMPAGYHANPNQDMSYTFNSDQNQSRTVGITGDQQSGNVTVYVDTYNGNQFEGQYTKSIPVSGLTGNSYTIDPNSYAPAGYRSQNGTFTGQFTPNGLSQGDVTFKYNAQAGTAVNVNYINQDNKTVKHGTIAGDVNDSGIVATKVPLPAGYSMDANQPHTYKILTNAQAPINIHVTGNDASTTADHGQFHATINKVVNGKVISTQQVPVQIHGRIGDNFTVTPSNYTPANYTSTSNPIQGNITASGLTPDSATFKYVANAGDTITVSYKNQNGTVVKTGSINGDVDSTGNATNVVSVPSDYTVNPGQNTNYKISANQQSMPINVTGKPASAVINFVDQNGRPAGSITVNGRTGDTVSPSSYPAGFAKPANPPKYTFHHAGTNPAMNGIPLHGENAGNVNGSKTYKPQTPNANGSTTDPAKDTNNPLNPNSKSNKGIDTDNASHGYATVNVVKTVNGHIASEYAVPVSENGLNIGDNYTIKANDGKVMPYGYKPSQNTQLTGYIKPNGSLSNGNTTFYYVVDSTEISPMHVIYRNKFNADLSMDGKRITGGYSTMLSPEQLATLGASGETVNVLKLLKAPAGYDFAKGETYNVKLLAPTKQRPFVTVTVAVSDTAATDSADNIIQHDSAAVNTDSGDASKAASTASTAGLMSGSGASEMSRAMSIISSASAAIHSDENGGVPYESNANSEMASAAQAYNTMNSLASSAASASASNKAASASASASASISASESAANAAKNRNKNGNGSNAANSANGNDNGSSANNGGISSYESQMNSIINSEIASDEAANAKNSSGNSNGSDNGANAANANAMNQMNSAEMAALENGQGGILNPNMNSINSGNSANGSNGQESSSAYVNNARREAAKAFKDLAKLHSGNGKSGKRLSPAERRALKRAIDGYVNAHRRGGRYNGAYGNGTGYGAGMNGQSNGYGSSAEANGSGNNGLTNAQASQISGQMNQMMTNPQSADSLMNQAHQINNSNPSATTGHNSNGKLPQTGEAGPSYADLMAAMAIAFSMAMMALGYDLDKKHNE